MKLAQPFFQVLAEGFHGLAIYFFTISPDFAMLLQSFTALRRFLPAVSRRL
jgi:hypothetical protein